MTEAASVHPRGDMSAAPQGYIVAAGCTFPIIDLRLEDGSVVATGRLWGPVRAGRASQYTLLDRTGQRVFQSPPHHRLGWESAAAGGRVDLTITLSHAACRCSSPHAAACPCNAPTT